MNDMTHQDTQQWQKARELVAEALQQDVSEVTPDAAIGISERWDSLAHMRLVMALEENAGQPLDTDTMLAIESLADVADFLATI